MDDQSRQHFFPVPSSSSDIQLPPFNSRLPPLSGYPAQQQFQQPWSSSSSRDEFHQQILPQPAIKQEMLNQSSGKSENEDGMPSTSDFVKKLYKMLEDPSFQHVVSWGPQGDCFVVKDMNDFTKSILPRMFKHSNFASFVRQLNKYDFHKVKNTDDSQFGEQSWTFRHPDFHADRRDALENIKRKVPSARKSSQSNHNHNTTPTSTTRPLAAGSPGYPPPLSAYQVEALQSQVDRLTQAQEETSAHIRNLERNYHDVLVEMVGFQRNMAQQDGLMQNLIQYFLQVENSGGKRGKLPTLPLTPDGTGNPFMPTQEAQRLFLGSGPSSNSSTPADLFPQLGRESLLSMNDLSRRLESNMNPTGSRLWSAAQSAGIIPPQTPPMVPDLSGSRITSRAEALQRIEELQRDRPASRNMLTQRIEELGQSLLGGNVMDPTLEGMMPPPLLPLSMGPPYGSSPSSSSASPATMTEAPVPSPPQASPPLSSSAVWDPSTSHHEGLEVYTVGHLMPKSEVDDQNGNWVFDPSFLDPSTFSSASTSTSSTPPPAGDGGQKLRVRRSTYVPGWAVPPRVLLVDDDAVSRKLSSKFLQVFGCTIDVAVDGVEAVNKINLEKYDLVLMDIVMPKLDGVSATSLIRKFDHMTPIISMTSNSKPNEIMTYYSSGMNDVLSKPFTKQGMLDMLEKHLMHLKVIQQMSRSISRPPSTNPDGGINPLAGMGLSDEQYDMILQNIVNGESFGDFSSMSMKRGLELEDSDGDGRESKKSRFEVVE